MDNQQPSNKTHYVYISFSQHRAYIGLRSCFGDPYLDDYLGSYTDKTFKPTWKWVYGTYKTRAEAHLAETECIKLFSQLYPSYYIVNKKYFVCDRGLGSLRISSKETKKLIGLDSKRRNNSINNPRFDETIYTVYHYPSKTYISGTRYSLTNFGIIHRSDLCRLIDGRIDNKGGLVFVEGSTTISEESREQAFSKWVVNSKRKRLHCFLHGVERYSLSLAEKLRDWSEAD